MAMDFTFIMQININDDMSIDIIAEQLKINLMPWLYVEVYNNEIIAKT